MSRSRRLVRPNRRRAVVLRHGFAVQAGRYTPRRPERTDLYKLVAENLEGFLRKAREEHERPLPRYVEQELRSYLACGIAAHGFVHARCAGCGREIVVAFSCKKRGICPSCNARRMWNTGFVVADRILPDVPLRQWVLSTPFELRLMLAKNAAAFGALTRVFAEEVLGLLRRRAESSGIDSTEGGILVFQHRFGGALNLNTHLHAIAVDGVFTLPAPGAPLPRGATFHSLPAPQRVELQDLVFRVYRRFTGWLHRRGLLRFPEDEAGEDRPSPERGAIDACLNGSLGVGTLHPVVDSDPSEKDAGTDGDRDARRFALTRSPYAADFGGFGVHAGVTVPAGDADARARLARYCARAPLSLERLSVTHDGRVVYRVRRPPKQKQACRVMTPFEFLARICALIPPPRRPLLRFYGVFAPHSKWRTLCVPEGTSRAGPRCPGEDERLGRSPDACQQAPELLDRRPLAQEPAILLAGTPPRSEARQPPAAVEADTSHPWRIEWATLLKRTYDFDVLRCECGGSLKAIALVTERAAVCEVLERLELPTEPPPIARARSPD